MSKGHECMHTYMCVLEPTIFTSAYLNTAIIKMHFTRLIGVQTMEEEKCIYRLPERPTFQFTSFEHQNNKV